MKKAISFLTALVILISCLSIFPASAETITGTTGDCTWTLDGTVLTISGEGAMEDYKLSYISSGYIATSPWRNYAFTDVIIEEGVTTVGDYAFYDRNDLTNLTLPETLTSIGSNSFYFCESLNAVTIPDSVASIRSTAFSNSGITSATIGAASIWENAFSNCKNLTTVVLSDHVATIGKSAFDSCVNLTSVSIGAGVTTINTSAFATCPNLASVRIPHTVQTIGYEAFETDYIGRNDAILYVHEDSAGHRYASKHTNPYELTEHSYQITTTPATCTEAGLEKRVCECGKEYTIGLPALGHSIKNNVCTNCRMYGTTGDCTWTLDGTVLTISGQGAMANFINGNALPWGQNITSVIIEEGVTSIGDYAFFRCKSLTTVSVPESLTYIGRYALYEDAKLTSFYIPEGVTYIGLDAFEDCQKIKEFTVPYTVTYIGSDAFRTDWLYVTRCATLYVHQDSEAHVYALLNDSDYVLTPHTYELHRCTVCKRPEPGFEVLSGTTGTCTWSLDNETLVLTISGEGRMDDYMKEIMPPWGRAIKEVVIEDGVTYIGDYAFYNCTDLTSVTMADTVTSIGEHAFYKDTALSQLHLSKGLLDIYKNAFAYCSALTSLTIHPSLQFIGDSAFSSCSNLSAVYITDLTAWCKIRFDGNYANPLHYAHNLYINGDLMTELVIPEEVTEIKDYAFKGCTSLHDLYFHGGVTAVGKSAFSNCTALRNIKFKEGLITIGDSAFRNNNMNFLTIPTGVTYIGAQAFAVNESLTLTYIPYTVTHIGERAFETDWHNRDDTDLTVHEDSAGHAYALENGNKIYNLVAHTPAGADTIVRATCTKEGTRTNHCSKCGRDYTKPIPMTAHTPAFDPEGNLLCSGCGTSRVEDGRYTINKVSYLIKDGKLVDGEIADWGTTKDLFIVGGRPAPAGVYTYGEETLYVANGYKLAEGITIVADSASAQALGIEAGKAHLFEEGKLVDGKKATWTNGKDYYIIKGRPAMGGAFELDGKMVYFLSDGSYANGVWQVTNEDACEKLGITAGLSYLFEEGILVHGKEETWVNGISYFIADGRPFSRGVAMVDEQPIYVIGYKKTNGVWSLKGEEGKLVAQAFGIEAEKAYLFEDGKLVDGKTAIWANGKEYFIVGGRPVI